MEWSVFTLVGVSFLAFVVGVLTGIFGIGGGFLMTPGLMILFSVPGDIAVGTGLAAILTNSSLAIYKRRGTSTIDAKLAMTMSFGSVIGVLIGSFLLQAIQEMKPILLGRGEHDPVELILLLLYTILLIWMVVYMAYDCRCDKRGTVERPAPLIRRIALPPRRFYYTVIEHELSIPMLVTLGLIVGVFTGLLGIGGGVIVLPILIYWVGQDPKQAAGTSLVMVLIASSVGVVHKIWAGDVSLSLWLVMILAGLFGTRIGTTLGLDIASEKLKVSFLFVVLMALAIVSWTLLNMVLG